MKKKVLSLLVICAFASSLIGCDDGGGGIPATVHHGSTIRLSEDENADVGMLYCDDVDENHIDTSDTGMIFADNEVLLVSEEGVPYSTIEELAGTYQAEIRGCIELTGDYQLRFPYSYSFEEIEALAAELEKDESVYAAFPNFITEFSAEADGFEDTEEDDHDDTDLVPDELEDMDWGMYIINAPGAWEELARNQELVKPVNVGLVDSGYAVNHFDLRDCFVYAYKNEPNDHGTAVAGVMAADSQNGEGINGVYPYGRSHLFGTSWVEANNEANLIRLSSISEKKLIADLLVRNVKVINMSYGYESANLYADYCEPNNVFTYEADISYGREVTKGLEESSRILAIFLQRMLDKGYDFVFSVASGNSSNGTYRLPCTVEIGGEDYTIPKAIHTERVDSLHGSIYSSIFRNEFPEVYDRIMVVGSIGSMRELSSFSNGGSRVDVLAPGENINVPIVPHGLKYFDRMSGTSLASPHVAGAAAMVWSANNSLSGKDVKDIICKTADRESMPLTDGNTAPILDAEKAVKRAFSTAGANDAQQAPPDNGVASGIVIEYNALYPEDRELLWELEEEYVQIEGEDVYLEDSSTGEIIQHTTTDSFGQFELIAPPGKYIVKITDPENVYESYVSDEIELESSVILDLDVIMLRKNGSSGAEFTGDYKSLYMQKIAEYLYNNKKGSRKEVVVDYAVYDMNSDAMPELIVKHGTCEADMEITIYTVTGGKLITVGEKISGFHTVLARDMDDGRFVGFGGHMGVGWIVWYSFDGKTVREDERIDNIDYGSTPESDDDYFNYGNFEQLNNAYCFYSDMDGVWYQSRDNGEATEMTEIDMSVFDLEW